VGTYSVHKFGTHLKQRPEVYGVLTVRRADGGTRRYTLSDGTLTIQATRPLRGKFTFRSDTYTDWPASPTPGTTAPAQRGDLTISGSFSPPS
jgi:hypothetical protein